MAGKCASRVPGPRVIKPQYASLPIGRKYSQDFTLGFGLVYWGLTPQQQPGSYQGGEMMMMMNPVFWWRKPEYPEETTDLGLGSRVDIEYEVRWPYIMVVVKDSMMDV